MDEDCFDENFDGLSNEDFDGLSNEDFSEISDDDLSTIGIVRIPKERPYCTEDELIKTLDEVKNYLEDYRDIHPRESRMGFLWSYREWLNVFPFDVSYFSKIKAIVKEREPVPRTRREREVIAATVVMGCAGAFVPLIVNNLSDFTCCIFEIYSGPWLYKNGLLPDLKKVKQELILAERTFKARLERLDNPKRDERQFIKRIKKWFADENKFIDELISLNSLPPQAIKTTEPTPSIKTFPSPTKTKADTLKDHLRRYKFYNLEKVRRLSEQNKDVLVQKISENDLPYTIAMFDYLQFILYLEKNRFTSKEKLSKEVAKWLKSDKSGRTVRGNINSLLEYTEEDKTRYTAYKHKETVKKDYEKLK